MNIEKLESRAKELEQEIQRIVMNHSLLMGQLNECRYQLEEIKKQHEAEKPLDQ